MNRWLNLIALVLVVGALSLTGCSSKESAQEDPMMSSDSSASMDDTYADSSSAESYDDSANLGSGSTGMGR